MFVPCGILTKACHRDFINSPGTCVNLWRMGICHLLDVFSVKKCHYRALPDPKHLGETSSGENRLLLEEKEI